MNRRRAPTNADLGTWWFRVAACLWLSVLVVGCSRKPDVTPDNVKSSLVDAKTGKVRAGDLGLADFSRLQILYDTTQGNKAVVVVEVKATQDVMDTHSDLSARLRLHYEWGRSGWELKSTDEIQKWAARGPRQPRPYTQDMDPGGDSGAIRSLLKEHRKAQGNLYSIPTTP